MLQKPSRIRRNVYLISSNGLHFERLDSIRDRGVHCLLLSAQRLPDVDPRGDEGSSGLEARLDDASIFTEEAPGLGLGFHAMSSTELWHRAQLRCSSHLPGKGSAGRASGEIEEKILREPRAV